MKNNALVYSFHVDQDNILDNRCYKQVLYSIKTLKKYNKTIPVKIYISSSKDIKIPKIKGAEVIKFENNFHANVPPRWKEEGFETMLFHRWLNAFRALESFAFDNILYLDTDTIFHADPDILFKNYGDTDYLWGRQDNSEKTMNLIGMVDGLNDGQFILSKKLLKDKSELIGHQVRYINDMIPKYKDQMEEFQYTNFHWLIIQYGAYDYFNRKERMQYFDSKYVMIGSEPDILDKKSLVLHHYFNINASIYVPEKERL